MKLKRFILLVMVAIATISAFAQENTNDTVIYTFKPHWYIQGQFGYQYTIGEAAARTLSSPNAQIGFGVNLTPVWGLRFNVNGWQSKDAYNPFIVYGSATDMTEYDKDYQYKWYYVAPALDVMIDLTNAFGGYKYDRLCSVGIFAGIGANIFFKNDEAQPAIDEGNAACGKDYQLALYWEGCKASVLGQAGAWLDFRINDHWRLGFELQGDILSDRYNSKEAKNPDWYINALFGFKYIIGKNHKEEKVDKAALLGAGAGAALAAGLASKHDTIYITKTDTVNTVRTDTINNFRTDTINTKDPLRVEIFFPISSNSVAVTEYVKVLKIVKYMEKYPESRVKITGYADRDTGTPAQNKAISEKRAKVVKDELVTRYSIDESRITATSMGDTEQPYDGQDPKLNRVAICEVE